MTPRPVDPAPERTPLPLPAPSTLPAVPIVLALFCALVLAFVAAPGCTSGYSSPGEAYEGYAEGYSDSVEGSIDWNARPMADFESKDDSGLSASLQAPADTPLANDGPTDAEPGRAEDPATPRRQVIYSANVALVVVSVGEARERVLDLARAVGGHLQRSDANSIVVRVPAASFEATLHQIEELGEVVERNVLASDVTEELFDLGIRLENARRARERLLEHLAKSERMEDTLAIEAELTRVTGEIERLEGRQRFLSAQVALSTIEVRFGTIGPRNDDGLLIPFDWVGRLGDGLIAGTVSARPKRPRILASGPRFEAPPEFLRYYQDSDLVEAMDADGLRLKVQRQSNYDRGALAFWQKLARRSLVEGRSVAISEERELDDDHALLRGTREVGTQTHGYMLVLVRTEKRVLTFEAWGPRAQFDAAYPKLLASAQSLRP